MKKFTFVFFGFDCYDFPFAYHLKQEGYEVIMAQIEEKDMGMSWGSDKETPKERRTRRLIYDNMIEKYTYDEAMKRLSLAKDKGSFFFFFDFGCFYKIGEKLLDMGFYHGLFPTELYWLMEQERELSKTFVKTHYHGLQVAEAHTFNKVKDAIKHIEDSDDIWVIKSDGNIGPTIVPKTDDVDVAQGQAIDALLKHQKEYESGQFILELKIINPIEVTPTLVFYNGKPIYAVTEFENKEFGAGNIGMQKGGNQTLSIVTDFDTKIIKMAFPPIIYKMAKAHPGLAIYDAGMLFSKGKFYFTEFCFDSETELLTKDGWKNYQDVSVGDETLSLNPETEEVEWKPIIDKVVLHHTGDMMKFHNNSFDALVTPDHKLLIRKGKGKLKTERAGDIKFGEIPRTGKWMGSDITDIVLPSIPVKVPERIVKKGEWTKGGKYAVAQRKVLSFVRHTLPEMRFKANDLAWLVGLWLAEGSFGHYYKGEPRTINISQSKNNPKWKEIHKRLLAMGFDCEVRDDGFRIHSKRLAIYLWEELGLKRTHAHDKFIPSFFKELNTCCLMELIAGFGIGDGHRGKNQWTFYTTSKLLADDWQEVFHKVGWVANIKKRFTTGEQFTINGKTFTRRHDSYILSTREKKVSYQANKKSISRVPYDGLVWDVEVVDNHSLFVRRNGKAFFSSNCGMRHGYDGVFAEITLADEGHGGFVGRYFETIAAGESPVKNNVGCALRLFNYNGDTESTYEPDGDIPIVWDKEIDPYLFLYMAKQSENEQKEKIITSIGDTAYDLLGAITGSGDNVDTAVSHMYEHVNGFNFERIYYRPKFDFLSRDYPSSLLNRMDAVKEYFTKEK